MKIKFHNDFHGTTASVTARGWRISQRQLRRIWEELCGDLACQITIIGNAEREFWNGNGTNVTSKNKQTKGNSE